MRQFLSQYKIIIPRHKSYFVEPLQHSLLGAGSVALPLFQALQIPFSKTDSRVWRAAETLRLFQKLEGFLGLKAYLIFYLYSFWSLGQAEYIVFFPFMSWSCKDFLIPAEDGLWPFH